MRGNVSRAGPRRKWAGSGRAGIRAPGRCRSVRLGRGGCGNRARARVRRPGSLGFCASHFGRDRRVLGIVGPARSPLRHSRRVPRECACRWRALPLVLAARVLRRRPWSHRREAARSRPEGGQRRVSTSALAAPPDIVSVPVVGCGIEPDRRTRANPSILGPPRQIRVTSGSRRVLGRSARKHHLAAGTRPCRVSHHRHLIEQRPCARNPGAQPRIGCVDQCHCWIGKGADQLHDAVVGAIATAMTRMHHGNASTRL